MATYEVKQATIEDLPELVDIFNQYRVFYRQESNVDQAQRFLFERFEHRESIIFIVKESSSNVIGGFTQLYPSFSSISLERLFILNDLFVREEYRKQGFGQLLLDAAKTYAQQMNAKGLELSTEIDNFQAQRLYEGNGYEKDEVKYHYFLRVRR
ncbi:GNAT family N-acetyltransferase [Paenibacillus alvei]|uniref:GNAT family N-acetyltransferase n=1 Tax=Paenibacillus alvei TaxID=44250 RepID=A0ABT4H5V5_PAEAL|nr:MULTISPECIES: GNAT family N-acetyltransferase [Paenibacillus]MCY9764344.1 GNAT family N-acetyltransferase [Paenibacillus alvei]MCY9766938.1 GNAT family N-acetyltransferase [Paenibacillus alvei]